MKGYFLIFLIVSIFGCSPPKQEQPPNILLILSDDQGWGDVGFNGNEILETPHLDAMAAGGTVFDNFYVNPVCAPTRAALLTGKYAFRTGAVGVSGGYENLSGEELTIAEILQKAGYATGCFGKWHNGRVFSQKPNQQGFDEFLGFCSGGIGNYFDPELERNGEVVETKGYVTDVLTDSAINFISRAAAREKPFFCYLPYNAPHTPIQVEDKYFDKYKKKGLDNKEAGIYGMIDNMDWNIGRLAQHLKKLEIAENTLIIFMSDNGPICCRDNGALKGTKGSLDEGGVKVPFLMQWPDKFQKGKRIQEIAAHIDILPTLAAVAGISELPNNLAGESLWPLLHGNGQWEERSILTMRQINRNTQNKGLPFQFSIRNDTFRIIDDGTEELAYNLVLDPSQTHPLSISERQKQLLTEAKSEITSRYYHPKPLPIGEKDALNYTFFADEAEGSGAVSYFKKYGYNSDWFTNWNSQADSISWEIDSSSESQFEAFVLMGCNEAAIGGKLLLSCGRHKTSTTLTEKFEPPYFETKDRITSKGKSSLRKPWKEVSLGKIDIGKGIQTISLRLEGMDSPNAKVELRALVLKNNSQGN